MENRRSKRITVYLKAECTIGNRNLPVYIENVSENGIYFTTTHTGEKEFTPGADAALKFRNTSGEHILVHCKVSWSYVRTTRDGLTDCVGSEIIDLPSRYKNFVNSLL